ncbi:ModD protein [Malaciobacter mytili]|uniref:ModD protein n=1 Tax=Malaciobacter mytili TaxID=603050 RepID=UPI003A854C6D
MFNLNDNELLQYINEDLPYFDLTTYIQEVCLKEVTLEIYTREDIVVACSEEAARIATLLNCEVIFFVKSKEKIKKDEVIIKLKGEYNDIQKALKLCQVLLEYCCKIATYTNLMVEKIKQVNKECELLTTRKTFPFAKKACIKAILAGNATPHRLGLSESILFFDYHRKVYKNNEEFYKEIKNFKQKVPEKKIIIESNNLEDCKKLMKNEVDVIQLDKVKLEIIKEIVEYKDLHYPNIKLLVAGGINLNNIQEYAKFNINGIVTSSMYSCGMANLGCNLKS